MNTTCVEARPGVKVMTEPLAVLAARAACGLEASIEGFLRASDQNLGHLEQQAAQGVMELLRRSVEQGAQAKAGQAPPVCPECGHPLSRLSAGSSVRQEACLHV